MLFTRLESSSLNSVCGTTLKPCLPTAKPLSRAGRSAGARTALARAVHYGGGSGAGGALLGRSDPSLAGSGTNGMAALRERMPKLGQSGSHPRKSVHSHGGQAPGALAGHRTCPAADRKEGHVPRGDDDGDQAGTRNMRSGGLSPQGTDRRIEELLPTKLVTHLTALSRNTAAMTNRSR